MGRVNGFFGHIKHNDLMSVVMFVGFLLAAQLMAAIILMLPLFFFDSKHSILHPLGYLGRYAPLVLIGSIGLFWIRFKEHVDGVRKQVGFRYLAPHENRRLFAIVETLALTAGIITPRVGLIETSARNAFACGLDQRDAVIVVTQGLLNALSDDELEAVIAHEITHVMNGDIRLIAAANVMLTGLEFANRKNPFVMRSWWRFLFIPIFPAILFISEFIKKTSLFALNLGRVSRLLIASSREYVADAEAVRLTHKPAALISALQRIENMSAIEGLAPANDAMMIDGASVGAFATHPTIAERIAVLRKLAGEMLTDESLADLKRQAAPFGARKPVQPKLGVLGGVNKYFDDLDAKEAAKATAVPKSLFDRVKTDEPVDKAEVFVKKYGRWAVLALLLLPPIISKLTLGPTEKVDIADRDSQGNYSRFGVPITAAEYEKMKRDLSNKPAYADGYSPSRLYETVREVPIIQNGLRGRNLANDESGS